MDSSKIFYSLFTAGEALNITASTAKKSFNHSTKGVDLIEVILTDKDGKAVYDAANNIEVSITGPAKLLGLESGDLASHESYQSNFRKVYKGKLLTYIQSQAKAGTIKVTFSSPGLISKTITYTTE